MSCSQLAARALRSPQALLSPMSCAVQGMAQGCCFLQRHARSGASMPHEGMPPCLSCIHFACRRPCYLTNLLMFAAGASVRHLCFVIASNVQDSVRFRLQQISLVKLAMCLFALDVCRLALTICCQNYQSFCLLGCVAVRVLLGPPHFACLYNHTLCALCSVVLCMSRHHHV